MVRNYMKKGPKGSHEFSLTINGIECDKVVIGEWFAYEFSDICVAEEKYHPNLDPLTGEVGDGDVGVHQHIYLKSNEPLMLDYVRDIVVTLVDNLGFDLQLCRSRRNWLIYITKEDYCPYLKNVRVSELSLFARTKYYCKTKYVKPGIIDKADEFIFGVGNFRNVVLDAVEKHMGEVREKVQNNRSVMVPNINCWLSRAIIGSFNRDNGHLYIYGLPGVGKTELIDSLIIGKKVFRVGGVDRFMFGGLYEDCDIMLFEDFKPFEHEKVLPTMLSIMDGKPVSISEKYKIDCVKMFKCRCIFLSNECIPSCMSMLDRRVKFFCVDHKMYDCVSCLYCEITLD